METAGGIIKALPLLGDEPFLVVNGDVWSNFNYSNVSPLENNNLAHLILVKNPSHNPKGDFSINQGNNRIRDGGENACTFSGIGYYHPDLFKNLNYGKRPLAPILRDAMQTGQVSGELFSGDWRDIGTPERLQALNEELANSNV